MAIIQSSVSDYEWNFSKIFGNYPAEYWKGSANAKQSLDCIYSNTILFV